MSKIVQKVRIKDKKLKKKRTPSLLTKVHQTKTHIPKKKKKQKKKEQFYDAVSGDPTVTTDPVVFVTNSFKVSFKEHLFQKLYDLDMWIVLVGSFSSTLLISFNWQIIAISLFIAFLSIYFQFSRRQRIKAIDHCTEMLTKDPDSLKNFLATISAPQNLNVGRTGDTPCEWINDIMAKFWPNINSIAQEQIDKRGFSKSGLELGNGYMIYFERFTLGDKPPALTSIHVRQTGHRKDEIVMILKLIYFGNCLILFHYKTKLLFKAKAGVKDIYFRGNAVVVLRPLLESLPFIGGVSICLQDIPLIDYDGINLANIADNRLFKNFLINQLKSLVVSPNKIYINILKDRNITRELKFPQPIGMIFLHIIEAEDLPVMDTNRLLVLEGSSDSYCNIKVGDHQFHTDVIYSSLNPYFGETFAAPIHDFNDHLKIEIFDKDAITSNDFMGSLEFKLSDIGSDVNLNAKDKWLPIGKCATGGLHFRIAIFELSSNPKNIEKIEVALKQSSIQFPIGIFSVYIYHVCNISTVDEEFDFKPVVKLKYSDQSFNAKCTKPPERGYYYFEESTHFLVKDIEKESLDVSVVCQEIKTLNISKVFGEYTIDVKELITKKDMVLNKDFAIRKNTSSELIDVKPTGVIRMFLALKVCKYRAFMVDNLKVPSNIQANIAKISEYRNSLSKLYREPMHSLKNPISSIRTIANKVSPLAAAPKTIVAQDVLPVPAKTDKGCWVKFRIKWPDRTSLHIEVLKVIHIPLGIVQQNNQYAICVRLGFKATDRPGFAQQIQKFGQKIGIGSKTKPSDERRDEEVIKLQKKYTNKYPITNYETNIDFQERLIFKISSSNNIDSHVLQFYLVFYQPRKYFAIVYDSRLAALSQQTAIPKVDFKGDSIEDWLQLHVIDKYKTLQDNHLT